AYLNRAKRIFRFEFQNRVREFVFVKIRHLLKSQNSGISFGFHLKPTELFLSSFSFLQRNSLLHWQIYSNKNLPFQTKCKRCNSPKDIFWTNRLIQLKIHQRKHLDFQLSTIPNGCTKTHLCFPSRNGICTNWSK